MTGHSVLCRFGKSLSRNILYGLVVVLALVMGSTAVEAQGSTSTYLPLVGRNLPGETDYPDWTSPFGVVMYGGISDTAGLTRMQEAGATWVVTGFHWAKVEAAEGTRDWAGYDAQFLAAKRAGMDVAVLVMDVPTWALGTCTNSGGCPSMNVAALVRFLAAAAERYDGDGNADAPGSPVIKYWTLFAEPDYCGQIVDGKCTVRADYGEDFKGLWGRNGAVYVGMLTAARNAIKGASPNALVTNGGIAFDYFIQNTYAGNSGIYDRNFMADVMAAGGWAQMDMLSVHYYPITMGDWTYKLNQLYGTVTDTNLQNQMRALPVISPEMGYWSSGDDSNEAQQARRLVQMFVRGLANNIQRLAWFTVFDGSPEHPTEAHGLFRDHQLDYGHAKPAFWAYKTMTVRLNGFHYESAFYSEGGVSPTLWDHEAYQFRRNADGARLLVAWANGGQYNPDGISDLVIPSAHVTINSHLSLSAANPTLPALVEVYDGGAGDADGQADGQITLKIDTNPLYILVP